MNVSNKRPCPTQLIEQFLEGTISPDDLQRFEGHLDQCVDCHAELTRRTAAETFWQDAQSFLSSADGCDACNVETQAPFELTFLDPTDDPNMLGRFGGYEICGVIGRGGMGIVLKGWDRSLDRYVAIKVLSPIYAGQSAPQKRFAREAQAAAAVVHDNVIAIYGVDKWNGLPYFVMPYVKGESLQQRIHREAPLSLESILEIALQVARGLAAAHDQGLVHRDIKPANILLPQSVSRVILTDFGLARTADDASLTRSGVLAGTPQYMSSEQAKGEAIDERTDLFSLGSVLYAMACGFPPFRADTSYGVIRKIIETPHRPLPQIRHDLPDWFTRIVDRLLENRPEDRFTSAAELAGHLEACLAHLRQPTTTLLPRLTPAHRQRVMARRRWWGIAAGLTCLLLLVWIGSVVLRPHGNPTETGSTSSDTRPLQTGGPNGLAGQSDKALEWHFDDSELSHVEETLQSLLQELEDTSQPASPTEPKLP